MPKISSLGTDKIVLILIGGFTIIILGSIAAFSVNESKTGSSSTLVSYTINDKDRPQVEVSSSFADLGSIAVKDEKKADFTIENKGGKPLSLYKISSSCNCTFGQIFLNGEKSPEFGMHSQSLWSGTLDPGKKATLTVIYRPYIMPVSGTITRDVYVQTNDPAKPKLTFTVKAFVK